MIMTNIVEVNYHQTGKSKSTDELGMREMQARAFEARDAQYLLLKAPPASGKSRAMMFLGLDKLYNQGNQPCLHDAWLFNYSGEPWNTQKWTREICNVFYGTEPLHG